MVVEKALEWEGTPFHAGQSVKGVGTDCLGFVIGLYREIVGELPVVVPLYAQDEPLRKNRETLLEAAQAHLEEISEDEAIPGTVIVYRVAEGGFAQHAAVLIDGTIREGKILHAKEGFGVTRTRVYQSAPIAGLFRFP